MMRWHSGSGGSSGRGLPFGVLILFFTALVSLWNQGCVTRSVETLVRAPVRRPARGRHCLVHVFEKVSEQATILGKIRVRIDRVLTKGAPTRAEIFQAAIPRACKLGANGLVPVSWKESVVGDRLWMEGELWVVQDPDADVALGAAILALARLVSLAREAGTVLKACLPSGTVAAILRLGDQGAIEAVWAVPPSGKLRRVPGCLAGLSVLSSLRRILEPFPKGSLVPVSLVGRPKQSVGREATSQ